LDLPDSCFLRPERNIHVMAILQEAMANVVRHAHARHVSITADCWANSLRVMVRDDGIGLSSQVTEGHGLRNMRDRASLLHGQLAVEKLAKGTSMTLDIPMEEQP
jgi:signal transduction histidine kinase